MRSTCISLTIPNNDGSSSLILEYMHKISSIHTRNIKKERVIHQIVKKNGDSKNYISKIENKINQKIKTID